MSRAQQIEDLAARWVLQREERSWSPADEAELDSWLAESDAHKVAFWRLESGWREADRIASIGAPAPAMGWSNAMQRWGRPLAIAASLLLAAIFLLQQAPRLPFFGSADAQPSAFATAVGGYKVVSLEDGSRVELNTDTVIKAEVDDDSRAVWLDRGEAFFDIAKQSGRKFVIYAGARTITVLGTKFSVRRNGRDVVVAVLEGRVRVEDAPAAGSDREATVTAGNVAVARDGSTLVTRSAEAVQQQLAWRNGMLMFDGATLASAAQQFNRYNRKQLVLGDMEASGILVDGSFRARNIDAFTRMLQQAYGLDVDNRGGRVILSSSRRIARPSLPRQLRPDLFTPRVPQARREPGCGVAGGECAVIPLTPPPAPVQTATSDVKAVRDAQNWQVLHKLYPARALAAGEEGMVGFTVKIDGRGDPTSCKITHTSGHPLLDLETCKLIMVHATFKRPAGLTPSQERAYEGVVNWKLPTSPLASVPPVPQAIAEARAPEEMICRRVAVTGSNIPSARQCLPKSQWQRLSDESKRPFVEGQGRRNCNVVGGC